ncbi:DUF805 domain-containing protein [Massilia pseudoviolaceinigra]|uniref:DUF805 domain-containing protein n=1 Tax=Massilia pseudoviolaceinigra TaxID=3057165 RepID=UPI00279649B3|nr:DUF805 domain-containing protein [Massilia sp. CCM 9206]MDQ1923664.1 DUF805 domain-containing protein [Massilia sp. CCM 9206]
MPQDFEQVLIAAQADGSLNPAWKKFVGTKFFVPVIRPPGSAAGSITLRLSGSTGATGQSILISEVRERVEQHHGSVIASLSGAEVVRMLHAEAGILVALSDRTFDIARDRVEWLRKGIEASLAKAAARAGGPGPAPAAVVPAKVAPPPVRRQADGALDIAALKPRNVTIPKFGLEFFVPAEWRQSTMSNGLRFHDDASGTVLEAIGYLRPDVSLSKWVDMRLAVVKHEMRYLRQAGEAYGLHGAEWGDRVTGKAIEFTGTFPGDELESRYLLALVRVDGIVVSIAIRAGADAFEKNRALYTWFLSRVDIVAAWAEVVGAPASGAGRAGVSQAQDEPGVFGFSMRGRIGRLRALAYSLPVFLPLILLAILVPSMAQKMSRIGTAAILTGVPLSMFFCMRLMVLRLHDVNLSGKWLLGLIAAIGLGGVLGKEYFVIVASVMFWSGAMIIYCFVPGTDGDNDYGEAPGPDSNLVKIGAGLLIFLQAASIGLHLQKKGFGNGQVPNPVRDLDRTTPVDPNVWFWVSPDKNMTVDFPGKPEEVITPEALRQRPGSGLMQQFGATVEGRIYLVQVVDYGHTPLDAQLVTVGMRAAVIGAEGELVSERMSLRFMDHPGGEVKVRLPGGIMRSARFAVSGSKTYMALALSKNDPASVARVDEFLRSFSMTR